MTSNKLIITITLFTLFFTAGTQETSAQNIEHLDAKTFKEKVWDYENSPKAFVYKGNKPAVIDFYADWCRPCKMIAPILADIQKEYKDELVVYKVNTQYQKELAAVFNIRSIPAVLFVPTDGQPSMAMGARSKEEFKKIIKDVLSVPATK